MAVENLITEHIDIWTSAVKARSTSGRGSSKKLELYGVKKLRELILELAVRGKLVPQNPNDEPASFLLQRISEEKTQLIKEKKITKPKKLPAIKKQDITFALPEGWQACYFGDIYSLVYGDNLPKAKRTESGEFLVYGSNGSVGTHNLFSVGSPCLVIGRKGSAGAINLSDQPCWVTDVAYSLIPPVGISLKYCFLHLQTLGLDSLGKGIKPGLNRNEANALVVCIPPSDEQHRIVAKVDELMALCDQLEQQTEASIEAHQVLVTTLLDTLTNSADADELMQNWARISEHFDTLFATEESIDQLKQTILQLAVMGALSQPLNSDTPIDVHLDNILEQQKQLATAKEYSLIEAEVLKAKNEISNNRVVLKARCFCNFITKGTTPSKNELLETGDVPFLKVYNIVNNELDFDYRPIFISNEVHTSKLKRSIAHPGDVIMNIVGPPLGKVAVLSEQYPQWNMNQALAVFKPVSSVFNRYLYYVLSCELTLRSVLSEVKGTAGQDNLSLEQCRDLLVPIMSIQEQQRLVCLVDSLWDYCDRLKKRMKSSQKTQLHLTDAVTGQAV
ncbi:TPA: restriction endonuclease subunit S [Vibrio parahaemolyticus]|nr:restriction endonuclease subunit S [Vibrio parahaemolyticus]HCH0932779.1 restriction endonuclease subunit S [Vibrio parahaemolyticus]